MREIKFKAQRASDGEWVGSTSIQNNPFGKTYLMDTKRLVECYNKEVMPSNIWVEIDPNTLCQFTGLVCRNGREIYEGDKITVNENVNGTIKSYDVFIKYSGSGFVIYNPDCCNMCRDGYGCICSLDEAMCLGKTEIIGNIHDK